MKEIMMKNVCRGLLCLAVSAAWAVCPASEAKPDGAEIRNVQGKPILYVHGAPIPFVGYRDHHNVKHIDTLKNFSDKGLKIFFISCGKKIYKNPNNPFAKNVQAVLKEIPDAYFILLFSVDLDKTFDPQWVKNNPDELCLWPKEAFGQTPKDGNKYIVGNRASMSSEKWKKEVDNDLDSFIKYIETLPFADRIIGYFMSGGSGEWGDYLDYSKPAQTAFQNWLRAKYSGDIAPLNSAWSCKLSDFNEVRIPEWNDFNKADTGIFLDPAKSRRIIDFWHYYHESIADIQIDFAKRIKHLSGNRALVGLWNGYLFMPEWWQDDAPHRILPIRRVKMFSKLLASPYIDFITAPYNYMERHCGGVFQNTPPQDSILLNGKLLFVEDDTRTHSTLVSNQSFEKLGDNFGQAANPRETENIYKRNFAAAATKPGSGYYYFGLGNDGNKGFEEDTVKIFGKLNGLGKELLLSNENKSEVAVIVSFESFMYQKFNNLGRDAILRQTCHNMTRLGAPFDVFLDSDLLKPDFPYGKYKMYLFLNSYYMPQEMRKTVKNKICRNNTTVVWIYAAGLINENSLSPSNISELTGFDEIEMLNIPLIRTGCVITDYTRPPTEGLARNIRYGAESGLHPVFWSNDKNCRVLGELTSTTEQNGVFTFRKPGLFHKKFPDWTSVWSVAPNMPSSLLRNLAKEAGVHIYSDDDQVFASKQLIGLNALYTGKHILRLPGKCNVYDAWENKCLGEGVDRVSFDLKLGENKLLILK